MEELQTGLLGLGLKFNPSQPELETLKVQGDWLRQEKGNLGFAGGEKHLNIGAIAKEVDMAAVFYGFDGLLSKLVHPTSFSIMLNLDHPLETQLRKSLFALGLGGAEDTLRDLIAYFDSVGIDATLLCAPAI